MSSSVDEKMTSFQVYAYDVINENSPPQFVGYLRLPFRPKAKTLLREYCSEYGLSLGGLSIHSTNSGGFLVKDGSIDVALLEEFPNDVL